MYQDKRISMITHKHKNLRRTVKIHHFLKRHFYFESFKISEDIVENSTMILGEKNTFFFSQELFRKLS